MTAPKPNGPLIQFSRFALVLLALGLADGARASESRDASAALLASVPSTCADCSLDVRVEGPKPVDGRPEPFITIGESLQFQYQTEETLSVLSVHVNSHGEAMIVDLGTTRRGAALRSDQFEAATPVGTETLYVFGSRVPFQLPATIDTTTTFKDTDSLRPLVETLKAHGAPIVVRRTQYVVDNKRGALRGLIRQVLKPPAQGGGSTTAPPPSTGGDTLASARITVPLPLEFATNSDVLDANARGELDVFGEVLARLARGSFIVQMIGHTDDVGADDYNLDLSRRRAESARAYLIRAYKIPSDALIAEGRGESEPAARGTDPASRQKNRRVEFEFSDRSGESQIP